MAAVDAVVLDNSLLDAWHRVSGRVQAGVFVLDADWVCRDVVALPPGLSPQDRAFQIQAEMAARFPALGDAPVCVPATDQMVHAVSRETLMRCDRLARALGLRRVAIGSAAAWDAMPRLPQEVAVARNADAHDADDAGHASHTGNAGDAAGTDDPLMRIAWHAAQDWMQGAWHGPDWGAHLPVMQAHLWRVWWGRCALSLGLGALLSVGAMHGLTRINEDRGAPTDLAALEQARADEQTRFQALQAQARWQDDWQQARQVEVRVLQVPTQIAGVWLDRVQQQDGRWHWQGEAVSPEALRQLQQALTAARPWHKPPAPVLGEWRAGRVGAVAWHFRLEAEASAP